MDKPWHTAAQEVVRSTIDGNSPIVERWMAIEPGSWGTLAGKTVATCHQRLGRRLTPEERRLVWNMLWAHLCRLKAAKDESSIKTKDE